MADLGKAYIQIIPSAQGISGNITNAIAPEAASAGKLAGSKIATSIGGTLNKVGGSMIKGGAIATAISAALIAGINSALKAYETQAAAETKLTEIYKTRMGVSDKAAKKTMELASSLQKEGVVSDEVTLSGAQQLATFAKMPSTVDKLLPAMDNLLVQQKGYNASAEDATQIANLMGKAMMGQTGALKRVGITFDDTQKKILETGTEEEKAAVLAEVITQNVGNMNEAFANTPLGKIQQMKNSIGDMKEQLGATLAPAVQRFAEMISSDILPKVQKALDYLKNNPALADFVVKLTAVLAIGGPIAVVLGTIVRSIGFLVTAFSGISLAIAAPVAAIGALIAAFMTLWKTNEGFRTAITEIVGSIRETVGGFFEELATLIPGFPTTIGEAVETVKGIWMGLCDILAPAFVGAFQIVQGVVQTVCGVILGIIRTFKALFEGDWQGVWSGIGGIVQTAIGGIGGILQSGFGAAIAVAKGIFSKLPSGITGPLSLAASFVGGAVSRIQGVFAKIQSIPGTVKKAFDKVKKSILDPVKQAAEKVKGFVEKIKGFINKMKLKIPKPKIPKISVTATEKSIGGIKVKVPKISWKAKGGIMRRPTLFGGGEAGDEGIVPLDPFWKRMDNMADNIMSSVATVSAATAGGYGGDIHLDVYLYPSGPKMMEQTVKAYDLGKKKYGSVK